MWFLIPLALGGFALWASALARSQRHEVERVAGAIARLSLSKARELVDDTLAALEGEAVALEPLTDPVTGEQVASYRLRVLRARPGAARPEVEVDERGGDEIALEDASGRVLFRVRGADLRLSPALDRRLESPDLPEDVRAFLADRGVAVPDPEARPAPDRLVVEHTRVPVGCALTAVGIARHEEGEARSDGYRGEARKVARLAPREGLPPILTELRFDALRANEAADRARFYWMTRVGFGAGGALVAAAIAMAASGYP